MKFSRRTVFTCIAAMVTTSALAAPPKKTASAQVERGRYLVMVGGCNDCHSPKQPGGMVPDPARLLSGHPSASGAPDKPAKMGDIHVAGDLTAWYGPWGLSYTANLTPDPTTGIGKRYNEAAFIKTMRTGKKPEGEDLLPPMPWPNYAQMTDSDLKAIYAYLRTLKPVENNVKAGAAPARAAAKK